MSGWTLRFAALTTFLALLVISSVWEMHALRRDGELRLQRDAEDLAKRAGLHLARTGWEMDVPAARSFIFVEMEDLRLAAMLIYAREGLLEGMRRNTLWEPVPWDDLAPENSVEASAPIMMEDVPVGEVILYLSRRALKEELSAGAHREFIRMAGLACIPCIALAFLLWQRVARRTGTTHDDPMICNAPDREQQAVPPLRLPPDWHREDVRRAYLEAARAFIRDQGAGAAQLCRLAAGEDWGELRAKAGVLREAALTLNARPLAAAALAVQEAALANTAGAARHVENCIPALTRVCGAIEQILRDNAESVREET